MSNELFLYIKKTNKHLYVYLLNNTKQVIAVSTDSRIIKKNILHFKGSQLPELLAHILVEKLQRAGIREVSLAQTNVFHGKVASIVQTIRKYNIFVR